MTGKEVSIRTMTIVGSLLRTSGMNKAVGAFWSDVREIIIRLKTNEKHPKRNDVLDKSVRVSYKQIGVPIVDTSELLQLPIMSIHL